MLHNEVNKVNYLEGADLPLKLSIIYPSRKNIHSKNVTKAIAQLRIAQAQTIPILIE